MGKRSENFAKAEEKIKSMSKEEMAERALRSLSTLMSIFLGARYDNQTIILSVIKAIQLGSGCKVTAERRELIKQTICKATTADPDEYADSIISYAERSITEEDYNLVDAIARLGKQAAMEYLDYLLCFAYYDGELDDEIAARLEKIYYLPLMTDFY